KTDNDAPSQREYLVELKANFQYPYYKLWGAIPGGGVAELDGGNAFVQQWHHFVGVIDRKTTHRMKLYIDGVATDSLVDNTVGFVPNTHPLYLGAGEGSWESISVPKCTMDDLRMYSRALSAGEIAALYNSGSDTIQYELHASWNLLSLPSLVDYERRSSIFPTAVTPAFSYDGSYHQRDTLIHGPGYWIKFGADQTVAFHGTLTRTDTIPVIAGWNMVGAIGSAIAVTDVSSIPGGIVTSEFFRYEGSYVAADSLQPTKGYWVKTNGSGVLIVSSSKANPSNRIRITPISELPPPPPEAASESKLPAEYALIGNYPNPFNPSTVISFALPKAGVVTLKVYNIIGEEVATLVDGTLDAGYRSVTWNATDLPSGLYFYRLRANAFEETRKLLLLR
ncbi:MAG TPA: LamG-like jellyroll fold domain-containing protein, partial [Bacteroidota bacterium]|nr:LamG-like jellyroll fold domain-containing protein [Bacteroidota bacterium]